MATKFQTALREAAAAMAVALKEPQSAARAEQQDRNRAANQTLVDASNGMREIYQDLRS